MMIDRRGFAAGMALVAIAPVVAPSFELLSSPLATDAAGIGRVVFMIEGWSSRDGSATGDEVWIRVGRSWRTAWR
jgi:hypothetical protein